MRISDFCYSLIHCSEHVLFIPQNPYLKSKQIKGITDILLGEGGVGEYSPGFQCHSKYDPCLSMIVSNDSDDSSSWKLPPAQLSLKDCLSFPTSYPPSLSQTFPSAGMLPPRD